MKIQFKIVFYCQEVIFALFLFIIIKHHMILGPTGFDSRRSSGVCMPGVGSSTRKKNFQFIIGETNYALAA